MNIYIAYRDLYDYFQKNTGMGGNPVNDEFRLCTVKDDIYLLSDGKGKYAVTKETAERFVEEVLSKCTEKHRGFFPLEPSINGKTKAAVVEIHGDSPRDYFYYDMDEEVLLKMLEDLREKSGEPLSRRELINYCNPNPELPEDFEPVSITHQIYSGPDNTPVSVLKSYTPDKKTSCFMSGNGGFTVSIREDGKEDIYDVPSGLVPEIKEMIRELCKEPTEAFVETGSWESFVTFGEDRERIFTDPAKTMELLKYIASKSVFKSSEEKEKAEPAEISGNGIIYTMGINGSDPVPFFGGAGFTGMSPQTAPSDGGSRCPGCGAPRGTGKYCTECGMLIGG